MLQVSPENEVERCHKLEEINCIVLKKIGWIWDNMGHTLNIIKVKYNQPGCTVNALTVSPHFCQKLETCFPHSQTPLRSDPRQRSAWTRAEKVVRSDTPWQTSYTCPEALWRQFPPCSPLAVSAPWLACNSAVHSPAAFGYILCNVVFFNPVESHSSSLFMSQVISVASGLLWYYVVGGFPPSKLIRLAAKCGSRTNTGVESVNPTCTLKRSFFWNIVTKTIRSAINWVQTRVFFARWTKFEFQTSDNVGPVCVPFTSEEFMLLISKSSSIQHEDNLGNYGFRVK